MKRFYFLILLLFLSCSQSIKLASLKRNPVNVSLSLFDDVNPFEINVESIKSDTLKVLDNKGKEVLLMRAVKDENGEMVANDVINPVVVTASFKNVAERHGKIDLKFDISVPQSMMDTHWQIRLVPLLDVNGFVERMDSIFITGCDYRQDQLRGYRQYERFLNSIVSDSTELMYWHEYEVFMSRNPYEVDDTEAKSHYTDCVMTAINDWKISSVDRKYRRFVKSPILCEGLRLDTVIVSVDGIVKYSYVQTLEAKPDVHKASIAVQGAIYDYSSKLYSLADSSPITFYISSLGSLLDNQTKYRQIVVERQVSDNSVCWIDFEKGSSKVVDTLSNNETEIERIRSSINYLRDYDNLILDSVVITASCSPEGSCQINDALSKNRSYSVCEYFKTPGIEFIPRNVAENWTSLLFLVREDDCLTYEQKSEFEAIMLEENLDRREYLLSRRPEYRHYLEKLYPKLRTVKFDFYLHRPGMVKDTLVTTEIDTLYMRGLEFLKNKDYSKALSVLKDYRDFNTALCYASMDYNYSAMDVLNDLKETDKVLYLKALIFSRQAMEKEAVQSYIDACNKNPSFVHRGNLDPEISYLIDKYNINSNFY